MWFVDDELLSALYTWQHQARERISGWRRSFRPTPVPPQLSGEPRRVLVVLKGLLGDTILCTPVLIEARRLWPSARITLLGRRQNCELLRACPAVDDFFESAADPFSVRRRRDTAALKAWLARGAFDVAILALADELAALLEESRVPIRVGALATPLAPFLTHTYRIGSPGTWTPDERLNCLRCLGLDVRSTEPRLWVTDEGRRSAEQKLRDLGLREGRRYAVIHPYSSKRMRWWPVNRVARLAGALFRDYDLEAVLVCSSRQSVDPGSRLINTTGLLNLSELLAIIGGAVFAVSTDSGPFHMAGALQIPTVGLMRSTAPYYARLYATSRVLLGTDAWCEGRCRWDRCGNMPCRQMESLHVDRVLQEIGALLASRGLEPLHHEPG
jgi:ADP-heptose:LPS heptosyltransferase